MSLAMVLAEYPAASANSMRERIEMSMCFLPFFIVFLLFGFRRNWRNGEVIYDLQGRLNATGCPHGGIRKEESMYTTDYRVVCFKAELMQPLWIRQIQCNQAE